MSVIRCGEPLRRRRIASEVVGVVDASFARRQSICVRMVDDRHALYLQLSKKNSVHQRGSDWPATN
jgi:hypothetical protein